MAIRFSVGFAALLCACATTAPSLWKVNYHSVDNKPSKTFELSYSNVTTNNVCLTPENWPAESGVLNEADDSVYVLIDDVKFPMLKVNTGYCAGCHIKVKSGQTVTSAIPYASFGIPDELRDKPKILHMDVYGQKCWN